MNRAKAWMLAVLMVPAGPTVRLIDHDTDDVTKLAQPGTQLELNLRTIHAESRRAVAQVAAPWSDVTWKDNKGLISERYSDPNFQGARGWAAKHQYLRRNSPSVILNRWFDRDRWIPYLSPAEKYDLVMGTIDGGLAESIGTFLDQSIGSGGAFPSWWGLCEGSAASTMFYPEPVKAVVLHSEAYNVDVPFYAPDIKGLATMLWSRFNTKIQEPETGLQCTKERAGRDGSCFDTNPVSFHAALHHFLDLHPGILVADVDSTPVVWNFPVVAYSEAYYRPDQGAKKTTSSLDGAVIKASDWPADPRRRLRSPGTAYIVGVKMSFSYAVNQPRVPPYEGSLKRNIGSRLLNYELELDENFQMLGGEWVSGRHPDLLWTIPPHFTPDTVGDALLPTELADTGVVPRSWTEAARTSAQKLVPLRRVVEMLVRRSSGR